MPVLEKWTLRFVLLGLVVFAPAQAECDFPFVSDATLSYDYFRSLPDGSWEGNTGGVASLNFAIPLPYFSCYGLGFELGGSWGVYDWPGRGSSLAGSLRGVQQQEFLTVGLFSRTPEASGLNAFIAYDWMFNQNFGVFALDTHFSQIRFEASYLFCCSDEIGVWGTAHTDTSHRTAVIFPVAFRAIDQVSLFWKHLFDNCAETNLWFGVPYSKGLMFSRPGEYLIGASFRAPLTPSWRVEGRGMYMAAYHSASTSMSKNYAANICIGINYSFGVCDDYCQMHPYIPIANNSNFIADTSLNY